jgi:4-hydroxy-4-methyl-2-oxoglutarate aldolase
VLDQLGCRRQFLPQPVQPMVRSMKVVGRAMPVDVAEVADVGGKPFGRLTEALDQLLPGEVYLARCGDARCAAWGELLTAAARARGAVGAVIDGFHRDTDKILLQDWPVFSRGSYGQDAAVRASVVDYRVPIEVDGVLVNPGDLVVGDADGVVVVPEHVELEVLERALEKVGSEATVREAIDSGASTTDTFRRYGVL